MRHEGGLAASPQASCIIEERGVASSQPAIHRAPPRDGIALSQTLHVGTEVARLLSDERATSLQLSHRRHDVAHARFRINGAGSCADKRGRRSTLWQSNAD